MHRRGYRRLTHPGAASATPANAEPVWLETLSAGGILRLLRTIQSLALPNSHLLCSVRSSFSQILHALVAKLDRTIEPQRRSVIRLEWLAVHRVGKHRLRMHRACQVPARPVAIVEGTELHIFDS